MPVPTSPARPSMSMGVCLWWIRKDFAERNWTQTGCLCSLSVPGARAPSYEEVERKLASQPIITVPAITLMARPTATIRQTDGLATAAKLRGPDPPSDSDASHNLTQEAPRGFAETVME